MRSDTPSLRLATGKIQMKKVPSTFLIQLLCCSLFMSLSFNSPLLVLAQERGEEDQAQEELTDIIPDPFEPLNRAFFEFNDKLYFYALKPIATGYKAVAARTSEGWSE